jgi:hypothetical protein
MVGYLLPLICLMKSNSTYIVFKEMNIRIYLLSNVVIFNYCFLNLIASHQSLMPLDFLKRKYSMNRAFKEKTFGFF